MQESSTLAISIFFLFVVGTIGLSFYLGRSAKSSAGYFAAHGQIPWAINGIAFAGDYLSAASFLGICGMIAVYGYDGFLYSIGYLAGWIVALFVIAEPMKRLGKFTFADALDSSFDSRGIKLVAGISTLVVSIFYLIPQMVGAGALIQPLFNLPHWVGVVLVGAVVMVIVITAGMVSTTWVQFLKGSLLVIFSFILAAMILSRGLEVRSGGADGHVFQTIGPMTANEFESANDFNGQTIVPDDGVWKRDEFVRLSSDPLAPDTAGVSDGVKGNITVYSVHTDNDQVTLREAQSLTTTATGAKLVDGVPQGSGEGQRLLRPVGHITKLPNGESKTGPLGPIEFFRVVQDSEIVLWGNKTLKHDDGSSTVVYFQKPTAGGRVLRPGEAPLFAGIRSGKTKDRIEFISLMLALFCGTASLPHILIRYYTVKDEAAARKSTIVGIASIGFFYVLTLYLGLGAMTSGTLDIQDSNMAAPLLAKSISPTLFAIISAIAFTTVLGTVSGLILASSGAIAHDLLVGFLGLKLTGDQQVKIAKFAALLVGVIAIALGIAFQKMNVTFLVGWAFSIAASANLPSLVMLLFWKRTTYQGIIASVLVGMTSSLLWVLLSGDTYQKVYGLPAESAWAPLSQPGIVTIPLAFAMLVIVSLLTPKPTTVAQAVSL